jgi:hypothetical protein
MCAIEIARRRVAGCTPSGKGFGMKRRIVPLLGLLALTGSLLIPSASAVERRAPTSGRAVL